MFEGCWLTLKKEFDKHGLNKLATATHTKQQQHTKKLAGGH